MLVIMIVLHTLVSDFIADSLSPHVINTLQDIRSKYIPHPPMVYYLITSLWAMYCAVSQLFLIFLALGQMDLLLVRLFSDIAANAVTTSLYLEGKMFDPDEFHLYQHRHHHHHSLEANNNNDNMNGRDGKNYIDSEFNTTITNKTSRHHCHNHEQFKFAEGGDQQNQNQTVLGEDDITSYHYNNDNELSSVNISKNRQCGLDICGVGLEERDGIMTTNATGIKHVITTDKESLLLSCPPSLLSSSSLWDEEGEYSDSKNNTNNKKHYTSQYQNFKKTKSIKKLKDIILSSSSCCTNHHDHQHHHHDHHSNNNNSNTLLSDEEGKGECVPLVSNDNNSNTTDEISSSRN